jgi:hypothetical protein
MSFSMKRIGDNGGYVIEDNVDDIHLRVEIQDFDKFSFLVKSISAARLQARSPISPVKDLLLQQAAEIERRIFYLLESFRLVEMDEVNGIAQVRSVTPHQKNGERLYYEILLEQGNRLTFMRYQKNAHGETRHNVPSHLSEEMLERLADDLTAILQAG